MFVVVDSLKAGAELCSSSLSSVLLLPRARASNLCFLLFLPRGPEGGPSLPWSLLSVAMWQTVLKGGGTVLVCTGVGGTVTHVVDCLPDVQQVSGGVREVAVSSRWLGIYSACPGA